MLWLLQTETTREGQRLFPQQAEASSRQFNRIVGSAAAEEGMAVVDAYNMSIGAARSDYVHSLSHLVLEISQLLLQWMALLLPESEAQGGAPASAARPQARQ